MKDNKHIQSFGLFKENLNISDVSDSSLYSTTLFGNIYKIIEVDEPMGGEGCKVLEFQINNKPSDIDEELEKIFREYRIMKIKSDEVYKYLQIYDKWNELSC